VLLVVAKGAMLGTAVAFRNKFPDERAMVLFV
jgi:hypothetical protein